MEDFPNRPDEHLPETTKSHKKGRSIPPIVAIVILVVVLVILGIRFL